MSTYKYLFYFTVFSLATLNAYASEEVQSESDNVIEIADTDSETLFLSGAKEKIKELIGKGTDKATKVANLIKDNAPWSKIWENILTDGAKPAFKGCLKGSVKAVPGAVAASVAATTPIAGLGVVAGACGKAAVVAGGPGFAKALYAGVSDTVKLSNLDLEIKDNEADVARLEKVSSDAFAFTREHPDLDKKTLDLMNQASSEILQASAELKKYIASLKKLYEEIKAPTSKK